MGRSKEEVNGGGCWLVSSDALLGLRANKGAVGLHTWATEQLRGSLGQRMLFREREAGVNRNTQRSSENVFEKQRDGEQTDEKVTEREIRQRVRNRDKWTATAISGPLVTLGLTWSLQPVLRAVAYDGDQGNSILKPE